MVTKLDLVYDRQVHAVRSRLVAFVLTQWNGLGSWRDADCERLIARIVPRIESGQQKIADLTDAYIRQLATTEFGTIRNGAVITATTDNLRGIPAAEVYRRPFVSSYAALNEGKSVTAAIEAGAARLTDLVSSGTQLAKTHAARDTMSRSRFLGYQRTLTGRENCALCVIASTQRYHRDDLSPIHPGCDCGVKPLYGEFDTQVIRPELLDSTYEEIATRLDHISVGQDARNLGFGKTDARGRPLSDFTDLIVSNDHGELGPVLGWRDQKFTSAADIAALA